MRLLQLTIFLLAGVISCAAQLPYITTSYLPDGTTGSTYSATLAVVGGTPPYSNWTVGAGSLPPGLTLNGSTGTISGTPSASAVFNFWVTVQDSGGGISPAVPLSITTSVPTITTTSQWLPTAAVGSAFSYDLTATGGTPPYVRWAISAGSLPLGLTLNSSTGTLSGTPTNVAAYNFSVTVQDSTGVVSAPQQFTIVTGVTILTSSLPKGTEWATYSAQLTAGGGQPGYNNWIVISGVLPPGLFLDASAGLLSGTPTDIGSYSFSVTVTDSASIGSTPQPFTIVIAPALEILTGALQSGLPGVPYNATLSATGGTPPLVWSMASGNLPAGLSFYPSTGIISGTPQSAGGTFNFSVQVTDAAGATMGPQALSIAITQASVILAPASLSFSAMAGNPTPPPVHSVSIFSASNSVTFSAAVTTTSGDKWLSVSGGGRTPGSILVSVNPSGLAANTTYQGTITISGPNISSGSIPVTLTIGSTGQPQLSVPSGSLGLSYVQGSPPDQRYLVVNNS
jgi:hypothetical protein